MSAAESSPERDLRFRVHDVLLGLAGRVQPAALAVMRTCLADAEYVYLAEQLRDTVTKGTVALTESEADVVTALASRAGLDTTAITAATRLTTIPQTPHRFARPSSDELTTADNGAIEGAQRVSGLHALWRADLRTDDGLEPVYLGEVNEGADVAEMVAEVQFAVRLAGAGQRVEIFVEGATLGPYHEDALALARLIWPAERVAAVHVARVFDGTDAAQQPYFAPDHPSLPDDQRSSVLDRLRSAEVILETSESADDVVARGRKAVVPLDYRSDGSWVWSDAVAYYLEHHRLAPDPELVEHLLHSTPGSQLSRLDQHRVLTALIGPSPPVESLADDHRPAERPA